jgi:hypothetical protein
MHACLSHTGEQGNTKDEYDFGVSEVKRENRKHKSGYKLLDASYWFVMTFQSHNLHARDQNQATSNYFSNRFNPASISVFDNHLPRTSTPSTFLVLVMSVKGLPLMRTRSAMAPGFIVPASERFK